MPDTTQIPGLQESVLALEGGGLLIYPTETFFALGCLASHAEALSLLLHLKSRPLEQGVPLVIGGMEQLAQVCRLDDSDFCTSASPLAKSPLAAAVQKLAQAFWPGPLSLILPASKGLPAGLAREGEVAIRISPHPVVQALCRATGSALVASSANRRGAPPAATAEALDPGLMERGVRILDAGPPPAGGKPSTLARPEPLPGGAVGLEVRREGSVSCEALRRAGFQLI